jgi:outer membrane biosynthesis protein TonB
MKLRFYMRGLGIGIVVTALIMGIALGGSRESLSDEEIKERAAVLGMVEQQAVVLSDLQNKQETENIPETVESLTPETTPETKETEASETQTQETETKASEAVKETESGTKASETAAAETKTPEIKKNESTSAETQKTETKPSEEQTKPSEANETDNTATENTAADNTAAGAQTVTVTIRSGNGSDTVSRNVQSAGLVESAAAFDKFLCDNGYSKSLRVGTYEIPVGASEEEIAKILTGRQ